MRAIRFGVIALIVGTSMLLTGASARAADRVAGDYVGEKLKVSLRAVAGGFEGSVTLKDQTFPLQAKATERGIAGAFVSENTPFEFVAAFDGNLMQFQTGRATYVLMRKDSNPLARAAGGAPPERAQARPAEPAAAPPRQGVVRLARIEIRDRMCNNMVAATRLAPVGWQIEGGVVWRWNAFSAVTSSTRFFNPNGPEHVCYYPSQLFYDGVRESVYQTAIINGPQMAAQAAAQWPEGSYYSGFEIRRVQRDPAVVLQEVMLPRVRKDLVGMKPVSIVELKEVAAAVVQNIGVKGTEAHVIRARYEYVVAGQPVEEDVFVTVAGYPILQPIVYWGVDMKSFRAAKGQLDGMTTLYNTIDRSAQLDLKWYAGVVNVQNDMQAAGYKAIADAGRLSKYISQRNEEVSQMIRQNYESAQRTNDRLADSYSQSLRGVQRYDDPTSQGRQVELPSGYNHAYTNPRGEIILSNDPNFNPAAELHEDWREMRPAAQR